MEGKIEIGKGKIITTDELFRRKERFHKGLSRMRFEEKIKILMQLWKIKAGIRKPSFTNK
jgi:hypothetical protein